MIPHVLFVFLDGMGFGDRGAHNPLSTLDLPGFAALGGNQAWTNEAHSIHEKEHVFRSIDARLGIDGLPQSGTGQTTLFTGINAAEIHGAHYGPYPPTTVRDLLRQRSLFALYRTNGADADALCFSNAFPDPFFRTNSHKPRRITATTMMALAAGVHLRRTEELAAGQAIAADVTNEGWIGRFGSTMSKRTPGEAADILMELVERHRFTLFEVFHTDKAGHAQDENAARTILTALDGLFKRLLDRIDWKQTLFVISSDHGNVEDLNTKSHTLNPVPLVAIGKGAGRLAACEDLTDVAPRLFETATED